MKTEMTYFLLGWFTGIIGGILGLTLLGLSSKGF